MRVAEVELDEIDGSVALGPDGGEPHGGQLLHAPSVDEGHVGERHEVQVARLQPGHPRGGIRDELVDETIEVRTALAEEVLVAVQDEEAPLLPVRELERSGPDGLAVRRVLADVALGVHVPGEDRDEQRHERAEQRGRRLREPHHRRVGIGGVDGVQVAEDREPEGMHRLRGLDGELHVLRGDRLAVVEGRPLHEVERVPERVRRDLPALREVGLGDELVVELDEARVELGAVDPRRGPGHHHGVQRDRLEVRHLHDPAAPGRRGLGGGTPHVRREEERHGEAGRERSRSGPSSPCWLRARVWHGRPLPCRMSYAWRERSYSKLSPVRTRQGAAIPSGRGARRSDRTPLRRAAAR
jgi:hypothetical protein